MNIIGPPRLKSSTSPKNTDLISEYYSPCGLKQPRAEVTIPTVSIIHAHFKLMF